jgi:hypothetical protein
MVRHPRLSVLPVAYEDLLRSPFEALAGVPEFLSTELDLDRMARAIDPTLRHY